MTYSNHLPSQSKWRGELFLIKPLLFLATTGSKQPSKILKQGSVTFPLGWEQSPDNTSLYVGLAEAG
jgi:hypothetical protein